MNDQSKAKTALWKLPLLAICAVLMILAMLRLGVWQLSRAEEKSTIVEQLIRKSEMPALNENDFLGSADASDFRFRKVALEGRYDIQNTVFVDNQVVNGQVGYQVFTPLILEGQSQSVMVARGFVGVGESRDVLPKVHTENHTVYIVGRLNRPPAKPPLWSDDYPVFEGSRWQFLPMTDLEAQLHLDLYPLVVELAPIKAGANTQGSDALQGDLIQQWPVINDQWVAKHKGYAFQWFAMAAAFFVACLVLLIRTNFRKT
jgi:surfeit locus 1 family protein